MILDTTVLVDLQRELRRNEPGRACSLLDQLGDEEIAITFVTWIEMAEGFEEASREACERFLSRFRVLWPNAETAWRASRIARTLKSHGEPIGDHDVWIAALALQHDRPVVTANDRHFRRVSSLTVRTY